MNKLFTELGPRMKDRNGGYTRILKLGFRQGDAADVVILELVDYKLPSEEDKAAKKSSAKKEAPKKTASKKSSESAEEKKPAAKKAPAKKTASKAKSAENAAPASEEASK